MYTNLIRNNNYNYSIVYEIPQTKLKDLSSSIILTEKNDADNDVYRNATTKATMIADIDRYSQGTFDLSILVAGRNMDGTHEECRSGRKYPKETFCFGKCSKRKA